MPLRLSELLADPGLGAEVVAGRAGIDRRGPIRWAHISELPDPTPWLEGGELLLTTGLGVRDDVDQQRRFVEGVAARGVVAVGFSTGVSMDEVPAAMIEACDRCDLPLFTMPYEIPFIAVTRRVAHHVFEERDAMMRAAVGLHRQVLATVTADGDVDAVLGCVGRTMPAVELDAFDFSGRVLGRTATDDAAAGDDRSLWAALPRDRNRGTSVIDGAQVTFSAIAVGDQVEAVVVARSPDALLEHETLLFEQGVAGVHLVVARDRSARDARRRRIDELFEEVVAGRASAAAIERTLARIGAETTESYQVLAVRSPTASAAAICGLVEDALAASGSPVVGRLDGVVHALVPHPGSTGSAADSPFGMDAAGTRSGAATATGVGDAAEQILHAGRRRGWTELRVGRSRTKHGADALRAGLRESRVAVNLDRPAGISDVDELGLPGLLAGIRDDLGASDFVAQVLGPVLDHDAQDGALVATLRAYLAHGCRPGPAADELCIHRHTLAYRLERIRELTGRDPRSGAHLTEYGLALALLDRDGR